MACSVAYADECTDEQINSGYSTSEIGDTDYCVDEDGYTEDGYNPDDDSWKDGSTIPLDFSGPINCEGTCDIPSNYQGDSVDCQGNCDVDPGYRGQVKCTGDCSVGDFGFTGSAKTDDFPKIRLQEGSATTANGGKVTAPAYVNTDTNTVSLGVSLPGEDGAGSYTAPDGTVYKGVVNYNEDTGEADFVGIGGTLTTADGRVIPIQASNGVKYDPNTGRLTGTAGADCSVDGFEFREGQEFSIVIKEEGGITTVDIESGDVEALPEDPNLKINVGPNGRARLPDGTILDEGSATSQGDGSYAVNQGSTILADSDGDGERDRVYVASGNWYSYPDRDPQFDGRIQMDLGGTNNVPDLMFDSKNNDMVTFDQRGLCSGVDKPCIALADAASFKGEEYGRTLIVDADENTDLDVGINEDISPKLDFLGVRAPDEPEGLVRVHEGDFDSMSLDAGFTPENTISVPPLDSMGGVDLTTVNNLAAMLGGDLYMFSRETPEGPLQCTNCDDEIASWTPPGQGSQDLNTDGPGGQATSFFSFIGKAWGWITGNAAEREICTSPGTIIGSDEPTGEHDYKYKGKDGNKYKLDVKRYGPKENKGNLFYVYVVTLHKDVCVPQGKNREVCSYEKQRTHSYSVLAGKDGEPQYGYLEAFTQGDERARTVNEVIKYYKDEDHESPLTEGQLRTVFLTKQEQARIDSYKECPPCPEDDEWCDKTFDNIRGKWYSNCVEEYTEDDSEPEQEEEEVPAEPQQPAEPSDKSSEKTQAEWVAECEGISGCMDCAESSCEGWATNVNARTLCIINCIQENK
ncbi:hypothetical protein GF345_00415 [Candidatus Woesearchaeota archaeon]|nr:hypothetical protein [Candidatus Woesearchaeota archaeon]